jgi:uncharacterized protein YlzI (FlbEa/FlbD family)
LIRLTRLNGETFYLNVDMVERADPHNGDTTISTVGGNVYTVTETVEDVANAVRMEKAAILRLSSVDSGPHLHVIDGGGDGS